MRFRALATDYDGTLARHGRVPARALEALERLRAAGGRVVLVTGRTMDELRAVFAELDDCDAVVAENGALLHLPASGVTRLLAPPPPAAFVAGLRARGVTPIITGEVIVSTREPHEQDALDEIRRLGLELQVTFNKGNVMILPSGVNKASGLAHACDALDLDPDEVVAVGDAENDHALLEAAGYGAAVANALPALRAHADRVTCGEASAGVVELVDAMLADAL